MRTYRERATIRSQVYPHRGPEPTVVASPRNELDEADQGRDHRVMGADPKAVGSAPVRETCGELYIH